MHGLGQDIQATDATTTTPGADVLMATPKNRAPLPSRYTSRARKARRDYIEGVESGAIPMPAQGSQTPEARSLAGLASLARWGKAPKGMKPYGLISGITKTTYKV
jgi:hypothetical protein